MKRILCLCCLTLALVPLFVAQGQAPAPNKGARKMPPKPGIPGLSKPIDTLKPDAIFPVEGVPDWLTMTEDAAWVSNKPKDSISRMDVKSNKVVATIPVGKKPCSGLAAGFGSVWVPNCEDKTVSRVDVKTNKVVAIIPVGPAHTEGGITCNEDSVWVPSDPKGIVSRIDPSTNKVVADIVVAPGSFAAKFGLGAVWVTSTEKSLVSRINPLNNLVEAEIAVDEKPRFLAVGEGFVWTLNQGKGTVSKIDPKLNKVVATIEVGIPGGGGEIAAGDGSVWVTAFQFPVSRIDPETNKVTYQLAGPGGDAIAVGHKSVWLSNLREQNVWRFPPHRAGGKELD
jgi:virginiamycin B lyase